MRSSSVCDQGLVSRLGSAGVKVVECVVDWDLLLASRLLLGGGGFLPAFVFTTMSSNVFTLGVLEIRSIGASRVQTTQ